MFVIDNFETVRVMKIYCRFEIEKVVLDYDEILQNKKNAAG